MKYYWKIHTHTHIQEKAGRKIKIKYKKQLPFLNSSQNKSGKFQAKQANKTKYFICR